MTGLQLAQDQGRLVVGDFRKNKTTLFELSGNKMQGRYSLIKTGFGGGRRRRTRTGCSSSGNEGI